MDTGVTLTSGWSRSLGVSSAPPQMAVFLICSQRVSEAFCLNGEHKTGANALVIDDSCS